jgi:5-methylthioribose kinase
MRQSGFPLPGGVASDIRLINTPEGEVVVKTALPKLKVAADWFSDPARSATEVAALKAMAELIGPDAVPRVLWSDPTRYAFAMARIDPRLRNWKQDLLAGRIDLRTAGRAGELLGALHGRSASRPDLAVRFANDTYFNELRIEPYLRRIAQRNFDLAPAVAAVIDGLSRRREALVHGDYSPKNILADGGEVVVLDCEVAHWGDPRFDLGFVLAHLALKALRRPADAGRLAQAARTLLEAYQSEGLPVLDRDLVQVVGCLVLARLEGDSPVDYLGEIDRDVAKHLARSLIVGASTVPVLQQIFPAR